MYNSWQSYGVGAIMLALILLCYGLIISVLDGRALFHLFPA
jgi:hypothetical protein